MLKSRGHIIIEPVEFNSPHAQPGALYVGLFPTSPDGAAVYREITIGSDTFRAFLFAWQGASDVQVDAALEASTFDSSMRRKVKAEYLRRHIPYMQNEIAEKTKALQRAHGQLASAEAKLHATRTLPVVGGETEDTQPLREQVEELREQQRMLREALEQRSKDVEKEQALKRALQEGLPSLSSL